MINAAYLSYDEIDHIFEFKNVDLQWGSETWSDDVDDISICSKYWFNDPDSPDPCLNSGFDEVYKNKCSNLNPMWNPHGEKKDQRLPSPSNEHVPLGQRTNDYSCLRNTFPEAFAYYNGESQLITMDSRQWQTTGNVDILKCENSDSSDDSDSSDSSNDGIENEKIDDAFEEQPEPPKHFDHCYQKPSFARHETSQSDSDEQEIDVEKDYVNRLRGVIEETLNDQPKKTATRRTAASNTRNAPRRRATSTTKAAQIQKVTEQKRPVKRKAPAPKKGKTTAQPAKRRRPNKIIVDETKDYDDDDDDDDDSDGQVVPCNERVRKTKMSRAEEIDKRLEHNILERKRRTDMKALFQHLRILVPETANNTKASKVLILKKGTEYVRVLTYRNKELRNTYESLIHKNTFLVNKAERCNKFFKKTLGFNERSQMLTFDRSKEFYSKLAI